MKIFTGCAKRFSCGGRTYGYRSVPLEDPTKKDQFGRSPRWIAAKLNRQGVSSSRGSTWSASALHGDFERGTGLLNNPLYISEFIWNRSEWARYPETRRRIRKIQPQEEWVTVPLPDTSALCRKSSGRR